MSVLVHLVDPPEYYTNLDVVRGEVKLTLAKPETVGTVVVKLEGESNTLLVVPPVAGEDGWSYRNTPLRDLAEAGAAGGPAAKKAGPGGDSLPPRPPPGTVVEESHKVLYQVARVHPSRQHDEPAAAETLLPAGVHTFPFRFKLPFNNACADPAALARIGGGLVDVDADGAGGSGIRLMDSSKQRLYRHVKQTLPPSFAGYRAAAETAEVRYFVKVTVQRPGLFKGNWRHSAGFRFLPIEPLRPPPSTREVFARRPFAFRPRVVPTGAPTLRPPAAATSPSSSSSSLGKKQSTSFFRSSSSPSLSPTLAASASFSAASSPRRSTFADDPAPDVCRDGLAPSVLLTALLPFPAILTCHEPVPLRLMARKLEPSREQVYLTSLEVRLVGTTRLRAQDVEQAKTAHWMVVTRRNLAIPVCDPDGPVGSEIVLPSDVWRDTPLPNTVMPSFVTCNVDRQYHLEVRAGLCWSVLPLTDDGTGDGAAGGGSGSSTATAMSTAIATTEYEISALQRELERDLSKVRREQIREQEKRLREQHKAQLKAQHKEQKRDQKAASKAMKVMKPRPPHLLPQTILLPLTLHGVQVYSGIKPNQALVDAVTRHQQQRRRRGGGTEHARQAHAPYPSQPPRRPLAPPGQPVFEMSADVPPAVPRRPDGSVYVPPSPSSPSSSAAAAAAAGSGSAPYHPPSVPGAVEMSGLPVIRRRPVPPQFAAAQQQQQQQQQRRQQSTRREKFPPGEGDGTVMVSYHGVVSPMSPAVASAIDAFAFADGDGGSCFSDGGNGTYHAYGHEEPPPSYDEAMADGAGWGGSGGGGGGGGGGSVSGGGGVSDGHALGGSASGGQASASGSSDEHGAAAALRPAFSGEADEPAMRAGRRNGQSA